VGLRRFGRPISRALHDQRASIFQHGGFGKPHALGVLTLVVLAAALLAEYSSLFGRASRYVATIGNSTAFFFHFIPAATETFTRPPLGAPLLPNADAPELQVIVGAFFVVFLLGATLQVLPQALQVLFNKRVRLSCKRSIEIQAAARACNPAPPAKIIVETLLHQERLS
jgi:hypothetical protein